MTPRRRAQDPGSPAAAGQPRQPRDHTPDTIRHTTADELAELDAMGTAGTWTIDGRAITLKNLDKILYPPTTGTAAVTKRDLLRYYATTGARIIPFLRDRPVNVQRFPDGIEGEGFWQKEVPSHAPTWLRRWHNTAAREDDSQYYAVVEDVPSLVWLGTQGVLELNGWTSTADSPTTPTWALIDIDPGTSTTWPEVVLMAKLYRTALAELGLVAAPKTTGQRGMQIWIPIAQRYTFAQTRAWVETLSKLVGAVVPDLVSWRWQVSERRGLARLDYTQNAHNKTLVSPYSPRPRPGAPVSIPIGWEALDDPDLSPLLYRIDTLTRRPPAEPDSLTRLIGLQQELPSFG